MFGNLESRGCGPQCGLSAALVVTGFDVAQAMGRALRFRSRETSYSSMSSPNAMNGRTAAVVSDAVRPGVGEFIAQLCAPCNVEIGQFHVVLSCR